jgi:hypothetical protein
MTKRKKIYFIFCTKFQKTDFLMPIKQAKTQTNFYELFISLLFNLI